MPLPPQLAFRAIGKIDALLMKLSNGPLESISAIAKQYSGDSVWIGYDLAKYWQEIVAQHFHFPYIIRTLKEIFRYFKRKATIFDITMFHGKYFRVDLIFL